ncbi:MAG: hypothetical protein ACREXU_18440 [Gammaproteobacteria bacterium]
MFIANDAGRELALQLVGWDLACRESNEVVAVWLIPHGADRGPYVAVFNRTTDQLFWGDAAMKELHHFPSWWWVAAFLSLFIWVGFLALPALALKHWRETAAMEANRRVLEEFIRRS